MIKLKKNTLGYNGACECCKRTQPGMAKQPFIVYHRIEGEKRGENLVACSKECAEQIIARIKEGNHED